MENRFLGLIENSIKNNWDKPVFSDYGGDAFLYKDMAREILKLHILFRQAGITKGDKIAIIGRNSARWGIGFFAILSFGAVAVPLLHDFTPDNVHHLVNHSDAKLLLASQHNLNALDMEKMNAINISVMIDTLSVIEAPDNIKNAFKRINDIFAQTYPHFSEQDVKFHIETPDELALINYTSGTTGFSKGVMIPYRSLWSNTQYAYEQLTFIKRGDSLVSVLPMAHMYGLAFEILNSVNKGCHVHFLPRVPSPNLVVKAFNKIRPTLVIAVPLVIEKIVRNKIFPVLKKQPLKTLYALPGCRRMIKNKILKQLNAAFGGNFFEVVIGGASINSETETFLRSIKFKYTVGYGMTECGPLIAYKQWDGFRKGSVGKIVDRMDVRIDAPNAEGVGEIIVKGMNVMLGYYKNEKATTEAFNDDGWLRTGDLGCIDSDGFLFIKGRNKTMFLSSNGQNIYPEEIESILNNMPYVSESLIVARAEKDDGKISLIALIYPLAEQVKNEEISKENLHTIMKENLIALNRRIPYYCFVSGFEIRDKDFEKTPKQSIKRFLYE
ncbi:MAG: AMP-binding protein [Tannerella sp.]|jgi:long-chain acyl-CoA synthetase|nr:AMP-binding protein [Tannerella sp.]